MRGLSSFTYFVGRKHRRIISTNLDLAFNNSLAKEQIDEIGKGAYLNLLDTIFGIMRREKMSREDVIKNISFEQEEIIYRALESKKEIIFVTGHLGNWELLSQALAIKFNITLVGVGRKLDSQLMDSILKDNRERFNVEMVYKRGAMKGCIRALKQKKAVGILIDQSLPLGQGIKVNFFGNPATHTTLASTLSRRYEVDLIPVFISTKDYKNYTAKVYEPISHQKSEDIERDILEITQLQADVMERAIRANPKEWFWQHKRWKVFLPEIYKR
jgi:KDO2-lipid IV(A) lauroyltransferase